MRNREQFLEKMRAAAPVIEELADVKPTTWRQMKGLFSSMEAVGRMGMLGNISGRLKQAAMFPMNVLTTRVEFLLEQMFMPLLPIVNKAIITYEGFVMANQTGALIGGGIGLIIGAIFGHPMAGAMLGALSGGAIESAARSFTSPMSIGERIAPIRELLESGETWESMTTPVPESMEAPPTFTALSETAVSGLTHEIIKIGGRRRVI